MRAFIIRPFGVKQDGSGNEIDFERVERDLIGPALATLGYDGRTTQEIARAGNIRSDMFRLLLDRLSQTQDEDGSLLDSTYVLWISDFGDGSVHNRNNLAIVLAGNPGVATGRFVNHPDNNYQTVSQHDTMQLYTSILNAFGFPDTSFGPPGLPEGPLSGL